MRGHGPDLFEVDDLGTAYTKGEGVVPEGREEAAQLAVAPDQLEIDLSWIEEQVGTRPYGVDLLLPQKYEGSDEGGLDREVLQRLLPAEHPTSWGRSWAR